MATFLIAGIPAMVICLLTGIVILERHANGVGARKRNEGVMSDRSSKRPRDPNQLAYRRSATLGPRRGHFSTRTNMPLNGHICVSFRQACAKHDRKVQNVAGDMVVYSAPACR